MRFINRPEDLHFVETMIDDALVSEFPFLAMDTEGQNPCRLLQCATAKWSLILDLAKLRGSEQLTMAMKAIFDPNNGLRRIGTIKGHNSL